MEKCDTRISFTSNNDNLPIDNTIADNTQTCNIIPLDLDVSNKVKSNNSQLLSIDGWENYQKELIQSCFELWEVNETQVKVNNSLHSESVSDSELQTPSSLFADNYHNVIDFESKPAMINVIISEKVQKNECVRNNDNYLKSEHEDDSVTRGFSKAINNNTVENSSSTVDYRLNKRTKKKLKRFSFYKNTSKHMKQSKKIQPLTFDGYTSCTLEDLWKYKKWLDSVDQVKDDNIKENKYSDKVNCDKINNDNTYSLDIEAKEMEQKVRKLIKTLNVQDKLISSIGTNEQFTKFEPSNKFKYFFKNAFRGAQSEFDTQLLDDYTKYIKQKMLTWQTLLNCLEDIRQRKCPKIKKGNTMEDTIRYRFSEINMDDYNTKVTDDYNDNNPKLDEINDSFNEMGKLKKNKFFKLLNKTKCTMDIRTLVKRTTERNSTENIRVNINYQCTPNQINGKMPKMDTEILDMVKNPKSSVRIRKSLSDTDLPVMMSDYENKSKTIVNKTTTRTSRKKLITETMLTDESEYNRRWDDATKELWQERQECFQTAVARLEYVGSTFKEQCRLDGLKTLCKVDVLAGFGYSAEAVDLFVSTLPLSKNPDIMIRKAEAAYDWKFFCHLSMWRYSYKD